MIVSQSCLCFKVHALVVSITHYLRRLLASYYGVFIKQKTLKLAIHWKPGMLTIIGF